MTRQEQITNLRLNLRKVLLLFGLFSVAILSLAVCVCVCVEKKRVGYLCVMT